MEGLLTKDGDESFAHKDARMFAFWAVVVSTASLIIITLSLPLMFTTMYSIGAELNVESEFCKIRVRDMWHEMYKMGRDGVLPKSRMQRQKRGWVFGQYIPDVRPSMSVLQASPVVSRASVRAALSSSSYAQPIPVADSPFGVSVGKAPLEEAATTTTTTTTTTTETPKAAESNAEFTDSKPETKQTENNGYEGEDRYGFCACRKHGPPGPPGPPGEDGRRGKDGTPGANGDNGRDGAVLAADAPLNEPCVICPIGPPGPPGLQGTKGPPGPKGSHGNNGMDGKRGEPGMVGPPGPPGPTGSVGSAGIAGIPGRVLRVEGPRGPPGKRGPPGMKGLPGCQGEIGGIVVGPKGEPGQPGRAGRDGRRGSPGESGLPGASGLSGDCQHCPPPRTPPGY